MKDSSCRPRADRVTSGHSAATLPSTTGNLTGMALLWHPTTVLFALHAATIAVIGLRVVMVRPVPSVTLAWLFLVALLPVIGPLGYLAFGERRLGGRRARRLAELRLPYVQRLREILHGRS